MDVGMTIYTSNRLESLGDALSEKLSQPKGVFEKDTVIIQSQGMAKWLYLELAQKNGIVAQLEAPFLKSFIVATLKNAGFYEKNDLWDRTTLVWRIFKLLPFLEIRHEVLDNYVNGDDKREVSERRHQLATEVAALFDEYMVYRQDWLSLWAAGKDLKLKEGLEHQAWQKDLWQELTAADTQSFERALLDFINTDDLSEKIQDVPKSLSLFAITNMPPIFISFFEKLAEYVQVDMFYLSPCFEYWGDLKNDKKFFLRDEIDSVPDLPHALLKSWGLLGRDFLNLLIENTSFHDADLYKENEGELSNLQTIQNGILSLDEGFDSKLEEDGTVQINSCHSPIRELEVLKDYILDLKSKDPNLEAHEIIVTAPDIQVYAPYISNVFEQENGIPYSISDRSFSRNSQVLKTYIQILALPKSRLTSNDILSICENSSLLKKFNLDTEDLALIREWVQDAAIRWGKDLEHRHSLGLSKDLDFKQNTWDYGFDRLLAGYAFEDDVFYKDETLSLSVHSDGEKLGQFKALL